MSACPFERFTEAQIETAVDVVAGFYLEDGKSLREISDLLQFGLGEILWCLEQRGITADLTRKEP
jgi:hypothetical protein